MLFLYTVLWISVQNHCLMYSQKYIYSGVEFCFLHFCIFHQRIVLLLRLNGNTTAVYVFFLIYRSYSASHYEGGWQKRIVYLMFPKPSWVYVMKDKPVNTRLAGNSLKTSGPHNRMSNLFFLSFLKITLVLLSASVIT